LILNKNNDLILEKKNLLALTNLNNFSMRLFLYNNQIYRKESLKILLSSLSPSENNSKQILYLFLIQIALKLNLALTLRKINLNF